MKNTQAVLGIDFGGVINDGSSHPSGDDTAFLSGGRAEAMRTPAMAGAFSAVSRLNEAFEGNIWIVSKCGPRIQERTLQWLDHWDWFAATGMDSSHVRFCLQRPDKALICANLSITHFVDDRLDVLEHMAGVVRYRFLFGRSTLRREGAITSVSDWDQCEERILDTLSTVDGTDRSGEVMPRDAARRSS